MQEISTGLIAYYYSNTDITIVSELPLFCLFSVSHTSLSHFCLKYELWGRGIAHMQVTS